MWTDRHTDVLDRMLDPVSRCLTPEASRRLVEVRADAAAQQRMDELADRSTAGQLSDEERAEYETYVSAATLIAILQAKARKHLASHAAA